MPAASFIATGTACGRHAAAARAGGLSLLPPCRPAFPQRVFLRMGAGACGTPPPRGRRGRSPSAFGIKRKRRAGTPRGLRFPEGGRQAGRRQARMGRLPPRRVPPAGRPSGAGSPTRGMRGDMGRPGRLSLHGMRTERRTLRLRTPDRAQSPGRARSRDDGKKGRRENNP